MIHKASREGNMSKIKTLGPYALLLRWSLYELPTKYIDIMEKELFKGKDSVKVYRGFGVPNKSPIDEYRKIKEKGTTF